ncbi:RNA polymerase sigma factor [Aquimonas sp.]|uniref:RNA polymerase sigma factor n=1 Tax=Aquimonas sp. TaxID=1872588 RepID=UPI0037BEFFBF
MLGAADQRAFAELLGLHQSSVRQFLRRLTRGDHERADDLAQEVFWKVWCHLGSFRGDGRFVSWVLKIAYQVFLADQRSFRELLPLPDEGDWADLTHSPEVEFDFDRLVDQLREAERTALLLHYQQDLNHAEVARAMNQPLGTVKSLIRRAREKLARHCRTSIGESA